MEEVGIDRCDTYCWHCLVFLIADEEEEHGDCRNLPVT